MGRFDASLKTLGDRTGLPATIELGDGRLAIRVGEDAIGDWSLDEIRLEPIPTGYRMSAEGDQILLELGDIDGFAAELNHKGPRRKRSGAKKAADEPQRESKKSGKSEARAESRAARAEAKAQKRTARTKAKKKTDPTDMAEPGTEPRPEPVVRPQPRSHSDPAPKAVATSAEPSGSNEEATAGLEKRSLLQRLDSLIAAAENRWGSLLPEWMFTRIMAAAVVVSLILMVALPGLASTFLLVVGFLIVVFGAAIYTDPMLGAKWLPGRMSPNHALLFGVTFLMLGVLLGVLAN